MPESQIDDRTPRGAWRLGVDRLLAERPGGVEAVDDEQGHEHARPRRPAGSCRLAGSTPVELSIRTDSGWWFAKKSRMSAKTTMPRISAATPMLLTIESSRTPNALISVVITSVTRPTK